MVSFTSDGVHFNLFLVHVVWMTKYVHGISVKYRHFSIYHMKPPAVGFSFVCLFECSIDPNWSSYTNQSVYVFVYVYGYVYVVNLSKGVRVCVCVFENLTPGEFKHAKKMCMHSTSIVSTFSLKVIYLFCTHTHRQTQHTTHKNDISRYLLCV